MDYLNTDEFSVEDIYTEKDRRRGDRRKQDFVKAVSRKNKDRKVHHGYMMYQNLNQYSKNKIHCSCLLCAFNGKRHGRVVFGRILPMGDKKRAIDCDQKMNEYRSAS